MNLLGVREVDLMQPTILCRNDDMLEVVVGGVKAAQAGDPSELHRRCSGGRPKRLRRGGSSVLIPMNFVQRAIGCSDYHVLSTIVIRVVSRDAECLPRLVLLYCLILRTASRNYLKPRIPIR